MFHKEWKQKIIKWLLAQYGIDEKYIATIINDIEEQETVNPKKRLSGLQTSNVEPLKIVATIKGTVEKERQLHKRFAEYRLSGEWFYLSDELKSFIKELRKQGRRQTN